MSASYPHCSTLRKYLIINVSLFGMMAGIAVAEPPVSDEPLLTSFRAEMAKVMDEYCYDCHGYGTNEGGVTLDEFSSETELLDHELWMRVLGNLRNGIMPPAAEFQPSEVERHAMMDWIKTEAFELDAENPDPGRLTVRRLNRVEYRNTIRDLVGVDFDTDAEFPADDTGHGFDNIADVLTISPLLLEKYLDAAQTIIDQAVPKTALVVAEQIIPGRSFQSTVEILPPPPPVAAGEQPAMAVPSAQIWQAGQIDDDELDLVYYSPASVAFTQPVKHAGEYEVELSIRAVERYVDNQFDLNKCQFVFKIDGKPVLGKEMVREGYRNFSYKFPVDFESGDHEFTVEIHPLQPAVEQIRNLRVRLNKVSLRGPLDRTHWVAPRRYTKFFPDPVPTGAVERKAYATRLMQDFATRAFRRPVDAHTVDRLADLAATVASQAESSFEAGVAQAMVAVLASPRFLFREEGAIPLQPGDKYPRVDEYALASRLSYFLWSTMPDEELYRLAEAGQLRAELPTQVKRMLDDPKSEQFVSNFTGQWLRSRDIPNVELTSYEIFLRENPDPVITRFRADYMRIRTIPEKDRSPEDAALYKEARAAYVALYRSPMPKLTRDLRRAMKKETEMSVDYILREDRSLVELLDSDYIFVNEDLAEHYGVDHVEITGDQVRKVNLPPDSPRGGILTQGTMLAVTSNPTRTSPVKRGVFILDNILGAPPPPPPPNIPALEDVGSAEELAQLSLRDTLALHASDPLCSSCHSRMDPLGLALENFNAMGRWRDAEMNQAIEPEGELITGQSFTNIQELKRILATDHRDQFYHTAAEKILTYAVGRGMEYYDTETLDQLVEHLRESDGSLTTLITAVIESAPFQKTRLTEPLLAVAPESSESGDTHLANLTP